MNLGHLEIQLLAWAQLRKKRTVESGEIRPVFQIDAVTERKLLSKLAKKRVIVRLRRGLYLVSDTLPPGGKWNPTEYMLNAYVMQDAGAAYQLCGPVTFHFYDLEEQIPHTITVYNDILSGPRTIGAHEFRYIKTHASRLGALAPFTTPEGILVNMPSLARTLMDAVYDWSRFNTLPKAYSWIIRKSRDDPTLYQKLTETTIRYGNQATIKRIGYLLERHHAPQDNLAQLQKKLSASTSLIPFLPNQPERGTVNATWRLIINDKTPSYSNASS